MSLATSRLVSCFLPLLVAFWFSLSPVAMAEDTRNVLVLYGNTAELPWVKVFDAALRSAVTAETRYRVDFYSEYFDVARFPAVRHHEAFVDLIRARYADQRIDVVVLGGATAFDFLITNRAYLPNVPIVFSFLPPDRVATPALPPDVVGVPVDFGPMPTIDLALRLHPDARRLVLVTGSGPWDRQWEKRLRDETSRLRGRLDIEFLAALPTRDVLERVSALPNNAIVFTPGYFNDGEGAAVIPREVVEAMARKSPAPVYVAYETYVGTGAVGGVIPTFEALGRRTGKIVADLLNGSSLGALDLPGVLQGQPLVDWRQLQRWKIDESRLPADTVVRFREPTLWDSHSLEISLGIAIVLLQAGLIGWLLAERRRRRLAEHAKHNHRAELAHASRLAVAGELTGAIAHEINQPLGAILSNADAADLLLGSDADKRDEVRQILADIRRDDLRASEVIRRLRALLAKHEVERKPFDLGDAVRGTESLLLAEARRRGATLDIHPLPAAVTVVGDQIQIEQVLLNLVLNALDAVAGLPEARRVVVVSFESIAGGIAIAVRDRGPGIGSEHMPKLFDSFFSTKRHGMGMGLSIARTLVEAHGGRIWAENNAGGGAVFHVELPAVSAASVTAPVSA